jgi:hypothetical protein
VSVNGPERVRFGARLRHARQASRLSLAAECVLQGVVEVQVEDQTLELGAGGVRIMWILAPGLPDPQRILR